MMNMEIKNALIEYLEDEAGLECKELDNGTLVSNVVMLNSEIAAKRIAILTKIYERGFSFDVICAGYEPVMENLQETMTFIGLINNNLYPGCSIHYRVGDCFTMYCYVDCYNDQGQRPAKLKIHNNFNTVLKMYESVIDVLLAVDLGYASAIDAYKSFFN